MDTIPSDLKLSTFCAFFVQILEVSRKKDSLFLLFLLFLITCECRFIGLDLQD